jgi:hypothetical protein
VEGIAAAQIHAVPTAVNAPTLIRKIIAFILKSGRFFDDCQAKKQARIAEGESGHLNPVWLA